MMGASKPTPPAPLLYPPTGLLQPAYPRVPHPGAGGALSPPEPPMFGPAAVAAAYASHNYPPFGHSESSAFYSPLTGEGVEAWRNLSAQSIAAAWAYDPNIVAAYPYGAGYGGLDVRRKNATRESTSTLKAWLFEHIKNPYPTKGEKIMLAIITKMTLTQVSTWFANARRRLKKENKMQWSPRNRTGDDDDDDDKNSDNDDDDILGGDSPPHRSSNGLGHLDDDDDDEDIIVDAGNEDSQPPTVTDFQRFADRFSGRIPLPDFFGRLPPSDPSNLSRDSDVIVPRDVRKNFCRVSLPNASLIERLHSPSQSSPSLTTTTTSSITSSSSNPTSSSSPKPAKPKIWSLADVATSVTTSSISPVSAPPPLRSSNSGSPPSHHPALADFRTCMAGLRVPIGLPGSVQWSSGLYSAVMQSLHGARLAAAAAGLTHGYGYLPQGPPGSIQAAQHALITEALHQRHPLGGPGLGLPTTRVSNSSSQLHESNGSGAPKVSPAPGKSRSCPSAGPDSSSPDERDSPPLQFSGPYPSPRILNGYHSSSTTNSRHEIDLRDWKKFPDHAKASLPEGANRNLSLNLCHTSKRFPVQAWQLSSLNSKEN